MITEFQPQLIVPGRIATFLVACILLDGVLFHSRSSPFHSSHATVHQVGENQDSPPLLRRTTMTTFSPPSSPVPVTIVVESLCPDCKEYMARELENTFQALGPSVMNLSLIVFGNAHLNNDTSTREVFCQHGQAECSANSFMQCAIDLFPTRYLPFVHCLFETLPMGGHNDEPYSDDYFAHCARHAALDWSVIQQCHEDPEESWKLQVQAAQSNPSALDHVPWVEIDGTYLDESSSLLEAVCAALVRQGGQRHPACPAADPSSSMEQLRTT